MARGDTLVAVDSDQIARTIGLMTTIVCVDVGSVPKGKFGWWSNAHSTSFGNRPSELSSHVAGELMNGRSVALGFECPLFVPVAADEMQLGSARPGEKDRAWSAIAGAGSLTTGLAQLTWVLRAVLAELEHPVPAFLDWSSFQAAPVGLFLWEAFVTGSAKTVSHVDDARAGAEAFINALPSVSTANAIDCSGEVHSLAGAALLRTGWSEDLALLRKPCTVIRAAVQPAPTLPSRKKRHRAKSTTN